MLHYFHYLVWTLHTSLVSFVLSEYKWYCVTKSVYNSSGILSPQVKAYGGFWITLQRPIISNVGTATYNTAKYLANLPSPLGMSDYTNINTADFINRLKKERIPRKYKMISFDVKSLFTNVPPDETVSIILRKIYDEGKIETNIPRKVLKE